MGKWLSVCLRAKWLGIQVSLQLIKLGLSAQECTYLLGIILMLEVDTLQASYICISF